MSDWRTYAGRNRAGRIVLRLIQAGPICWGCARCGTNYQRSCRARVVLERWGRDGRAKYQPPWSAAARAGHAAVTDRKTAAEVMAPKEYALGSWGPRRLWTGAQAIPEPDSLTYGSHLRPGRQRARIAGAWLALVDHGTLLAADRGFLAFEAVS